MAKINIDNVWLEADRNVEPLSVEEESAWKLLVELGKEIRAPIISRREEKKAAQLERLKKIAEDNGREFKDWRKGSMSDSMKEVPTVVKRWVVLRYGGLSFNRAGEKSGATWIMVQDAKSRSEEFRCALAAQEENSRELMKAKAASIMEQSQDEGAKVSMAQTQVAMKILTSLDNEHFGEDVGKRAVSDEVQRQLSGGGFVINLIGDAAKVANSIPEKKPGRALVYKDV